MNTPVIMNAHPMRIAPALMRRDWKSFYWSLAIVLLLVLQLWSGTDPAFALLVALFCSLTYLAVKEAGGPATTTGFCIVYLAVQNVLVSQVAKVILWDPADHKLIHPLVTMGVYDCTLAGIYLAAVASRRLGTTRRRPLFPPITDPERLKWIAYVSTALFVASAASTVKMGAEIGAGEHEYGGLSGIVAQFNLLGIAVASGTAYMITASKGRKSVGLVNAVSIGIPFCGGLLGASREGLTSAVVLYFVTCFMFRFRFRFIHYAVLIGGMCFAQYILFPYALYARGVVRTPDMQKNVQLAYVALLDVISDPVRYQTSLEKTGHDSQVTRVYLYYDKPRSTLDRFTLIKATDALVDATLRDGTVGMDNITPGFLMPIPRSLYPDKPFFSVSNQLAHREPGLVGKNDHGTGITTGFAGDAFSSYGWTGALVIPFLLMFGWFCLLRFLVRDSLWNNIFGLALVLQIANNLSAAPLAPLLAGLLASPILYTFAFWAILRLAGFATRTQEKILAARRQAAVRERSEVLAGRRHPSTRRLLLASSKDDPLP